MTEMQQIFSIPAEQTRLPHVLSHFCDLGRCHGFGGTTVTTARDFNIRIQRAGRLS